MIQRTSGKLQKQNGLFYWLCASWHPVNRRICSTGTSCVDLWCLQESILKTLQDTVEAEEQKNAQKLQSYETQLQSVNRICMLQAAVYGHCVGVTRWRRRLVYVATTLDGPVWARGNPPSFLHFPTFYSIFSIFYFFLFVICFIYVLASAFPSLLPE